MLIFPAIDMRGGKVVRLKQGDYAQETVFADDPLVIASTFKDAGATFLHMVDLDGAKAGRPVLADHAIRVSQELGIKVQLGGGIRTRQDVEFLLEHGVERVILGTVLAKDRDLAQEVFRLYGDRVVAGVDARDEKVATEGWTEQSHLSLTEFCQELASFGARHFIVTDIAKDGMMQGPNFELYQRLAQFLPGVIASGGVRSLEDLRLLSQIENLEGAIVGVALYNGSIEVSQLFS